MAIGPLESFVFPGVLTRTINEAAGVTAAGEIRYPAIIGTSAEEIRVSDFEMVRGSSATADNLILDEDVSDQFTGTEKTFTVENYPIVTGNGSGKVATSVQNAIVTVNGNVVAINALNGLTGEITLVQIPKDTDDVRVNYYFKRRDTYIEDEDISDQADGSNTEFKVRSTRIVKGDNGGRSATDVDINGTVTILYNPDPLVPGDEFERTVRIIEVKVNGLDSTITELDGASGQFTLETAPALGATVTVTYFTNLWQDTYDILPAPIVNRVIKVGLSQDTSDFSIGPDVILSGQNRLHWGHSYQVEQGVYTAGSDPLEDNIVASLVDKRVFCEVASPQEGTGTYDADGNEINLDGNKLFNLQETPNDGSGTDTSTEDPDDVVAYVGSTVDAAITAGAVTVTKIDGNQITLATSPSQALEEKVYVTYYRNFLVDDVWTLTNRVPGGSGTGKYTISSRLNGNALEVTLNAQSLSPGQILTYAGAGAANFEVSPLNASVERVRVTFDGLGAYTVSSKIGPAFTVNGRTGSVTADNANKGYLGQTYFDPTTGFTVAFAQDNGGNWSPGAGDYLDYYIGDPTTTDPVEQLYITASSAIVRVIPGINLTVSSTDGGTEDNTDDTVVINTFNKSGNEPSVGDFYYTTFDRQKTDYQPRFLTNMRDVIKLYGPIDINNRITLAANFAFLNGARAVAIQQIQKEPGQGDASVQSYIDGIDTFSEPLPNGTRPVLIQALSTDDQVHAYLKSSNAIQSSIRNRNERTSVIGFAIGTEPDEVIQKVKNLASEKLTAVYPDSAIVGITDTFGNEVEYVVDGSLIAAAVAGRDVSPVTDIATPLTNATVVGFKRLNRRLDDVSASLVANAGCTVMQEQTPVIRILMYLTTDMSTPLTRNPRIVEVKHFIQKGLRNALNRFIGVKNLPKIRPQIRDSVGAYFRSLKQAELIVDYTGINVTQNPNDPTTVDVEAYYSPVFPLNWIVVTLNLRSSV